VFYSVVASSAASKSDQRNRLSTQLVDCKIVHQRGLGCVARALSINVIGSSVKKRTGRCMDNCVVEMGVHAEYFRRDYFDDKCDRMSGG